MISPERNPTGGPEYVERVGGKNPNQSPLREKDSVSHPPYTTPLHSLPLQPVNFSNVLAVAGHRTQ